MKVPDWLDPRRPPLQGWALVAAGFLGAAALITLNRYWDGLICGAALRGARAETVQTPDTAAGWRIIRHPDGQPAYAVPPRPDSVGHAPTKRGGR